MTAQCDFEGCLEEATLAQMVYRGVYEKNLYLIRCERHRRPPFSLNRPPNRDLVVTRPLAEGLAQWGDKLAGEVHGS